MPAVNVLASYGSVLGHYRQLLAPFTMFSVFSVLYLKESLLWNYPVGFAMMVSAVVVIFEK